MNAYQELLWSYITAVIIQANDLSNPHAKQRIYTSNSQSTPETVYQSLQDALLYFNEESLTPSKPVDPTRQRFTDPLVCKNPHTFYLLIKVLQHLAKAPDSAQIDSKSAISQLLLILTSPQGIQFCQKDLQIDLLRREILLEHGGERYWFILWAMMEKELDQGDTNWATIMTAVQTAYAVATKTNAKPVSGGDVTAETLAALPSKWWNRSPEEHTAENGTKDLMHLVTTKRMLEKLGADEGFSKKDRGLTLGLLKLATWSPDHVLPELPGKSVHSACTSYNNTNRCSILQIS